jgi:Tol biopolymer transport system component
VWSIKPDGSDLRQMTDASGGAIVPFWSPDGSKMVANDTLFEKAIYVFDPHKAWKEQSPEIVPVEVSPGVMFDPGPWSPNGQQLAGFDRANQQGARTIVLYAFATKTVTRLNNTSGNDAIWLNDSRRLLFTDVQGRLRLLDILKKTSHEIFSISPDLIDAPALSPNDRTLYFTRVSRKTDIWLMRTK